ncbi:HI0074 family nucleotidyltransferase substrate-binding subunit [Desulfovibrio sp. JC022]|uniref:HI0074 family nucleotidyltransferase substrate-binding subunit n=1 Tax=Desulfovibrio sp. JC022 TaxID=2593642 RepID=UPI0013D73659|nr:HI0074 family nucleotidyltransferase substrate-binding subunit [Desulfovibrio sp. JC022]NDV24531.1 hypothetical protein [Desulfovibrio sp. JC022]
MDYTQFKKAILRFEEMLRKYNEGSADLDEITKDAVQDSLVKRFEYTLELAWKSCKRHLFEEGYVEVKTMGPKPMMRFAFTADLIANVDNWIGYINARNDTSHDYSGDKADAILDIVDDFYDDVVDLYEKISKETWE